jgi:hypothetical protein
MPSLNREFLLQLKDNYSNYNVFIETGTLNGETIFAMEPYFNKLYTIEFSQQYYLNTKKRAQARRSNINFILGDSSIVFGSLLPTINEKAIFFLDGHWSCGDTGKSEQVCPLMEEITHINKLFKSEAIIIIDDYRLFGRKDFGIDWSDISKEKILAIIKTRINNIYHLDSSCGKDDRLIIHINAIK